VMRRTLGFKLTTWGRHLMSFIDYCQAHNADHLTTELALAWAIQTPRHSGDEVYWSRRLMVVRIFARHLKTLDPATKVPPEDALPRHYRRIAPYLYSPAEITALIVVAGRLRPPLRAATWQTLIGLLAVTGLGKSEACALDRDQVDLDTGVLVVANSKFGKSRQVFLHDSALVALRDYQHRRDRWCPTPTAPSFYISTRGTRLDAHNITPTFAELVDAAGIQASVGRRRPRLHDRHVYGRHPAGLVPRRRERSSPPAVAVRLARPRRPQIDILVSARRLGNCTRRARNPTSPGSSWPWSVVLDRSVAAV
jgi:integrase/recombinase XerD